MLVKICGIQNEKNLLCCEENKVDFFGMIFFKKSSRNISFENAKSLQLFSKNLNINGVGVFVNENLNSLIELIKNLGLKYIQLHGDENSEYINEIKKLNVKIIKKIAIKNIKDLEEVKRFKQVDFFLFDYKPEINEHPGGNAKSFDWEILKNFDTNIPWFLSGGINLNNIDLVKTKIKPPGIDLSSGVEKKLGIKDNEIINNFMTELNNG
tara:strand:+ start:93 stop:722 length:630 start_codon:yes stop_codon:yes gene_type:complete